jgi:hypothetical protein
MTIKPIILTEPKFVSLTWKEFEEQFKPIKNHFRLDDPDEIMFETYGEEIDFVLSKDTERKVWTYADGDYCSYVTNGYHYVNRIGYYVCEVAYDENTDYEIIVSTETECECYNEEGYEDGEMGRADCEKCEGYGLVTNYND